jgi:hypothetical protein
MAEWTVPPHGDILLVGPATKFFKKQALKLRLIEN